MTTKKQEVFGPEVSLSAMLSKASEYKRFRVWIVGDTPLICHAWSHKAKLEMLQKQVKATKPGKEARDPERDFVDSLYAMGEDGKGNPTSYGFPVTGFKKAFLSVAHKDKGLARTATRQALWLDMEMVRVRPALAGAMCDMPLIRIYGSKPEMREDMGRIGAGLTKTANLIYRAQFTSWAVKITGRFNPAIMDELKIVTLVMDSGIATGVGEWRNEKDGVFGSYHLADEVEEAAWEAYANSKGPLPLSDMYRLAAEQPIMARRKSPPPTFEWSEIGEARYAKLTTPERLAEELARFKTAKGYRPHAIVEEARDPSSFFHRFFEWSDKKAADSYRVVQARTLIASLRVVIHDENPEDLRRARAFYSLPRDGQQPRGYFDVQTIRSDGRLQRRLLDQVDKELGQIVDRHIGVTAIAPIIAEARRRLAEERAKYTSPGAGAEAHL